MPGDIRDNEFGPYSYYYENRFEHHPDKDSMNPGCVEEWKKNKSNEQVRRIFENMRQKYIDTDLNLT